MNKLAGSKAENTISRWQKHRLQASIKKVTPSPMQQLEEANPKLVEESVLPFQIVTKSITLLKRNQAVLQGAMKVMENV